MILYSENKTAATELYHEVYAQLPDSWDGVTLEKYIEVVNLKYDDEDTPIDLQGFYAIISVAAILSGQPTQFFEELPMIMITEIVKKLKFTELPPKNKGKRSMIFIDPDEMTYDMFVDFIAFKDGNIHKMADCLRPFTKSKNREEILKMSISEVYAYFFQLKRNAIRYLRRSTRQLAADLAMASLRNLKRLLCRPFKMARRSL